MKIAPLLLLFAAAPVFAQESGIVLKGPSGPSVTLSSSEIAAMPHVAVTLAIHGHSATYSGVPLDRLMAKVNAPMGEALRGAALADVVEVRACDGYRVALTLSEIDPAMREGAIILADSADGASLKAPDGPFRLIVAGDKRPARSARCVIEIALTSAPGQATALTRRAQTRRVIFG